MSTKFFIAVVSIIGAFAIIIMVEDFINGRERRQKSAIEEAQGMSEVSSYNVWGKSSGNRFILRNNDTQKKMIFTACTAEQISLLNRQVESGEAVAFKTKEYNELNSLYTAIPSNPACYLMVKELALEQLKN